MIRADVFRDQPVLHGASIRLEPQEERHFDGIWRMLGDAESTRLTGTHQKFSEPQIRRWLATRHEHHDRADWAIVRRADDVVVGEVVLNDLDVNNASVNLRIGLAGPEVFGRGYGTEATRLVVDYAFDVAGLHRISLDVLDVNPRARRVYEKCGFTVEGVHREALRWDGRWHDAVFMALLSTDPRPSVSAPA
ncbi:RimJ/RimL family protein N-acetyltransferase [Actinoalloteichus hoggarensis]|nr:GNAT family protein [Actinoalloteichus hoggarensis]MBB5921399.1 RimJ/RimL family protein N-acetyltransferase [Actinoalloteichus hoggarensis]